MPQAFIGIGSNIEPDVNIRKALRLLGNHVRLVAISTIYLSDPEGRSEQPQFYNGVVEIETDIAPAEMKWSVLRPIEEALRRMRNEDRYAPRTIDMDLLVYDDLAETTEQITIPDPLIPERAFLAVPMFELSPEMKLPGSGEPLRDIAAAHANHTMQPLDEYTQSLREELLNGL